MSNDSLRSAMIAQEIAQIRSKLSAAQKEFDNLDILVSGGIIKIRQLIDPYQTDVTKLDVDEAFSEIERLRENVHRMRDLLDEINNLKAALGEK